MKNGKRLSTGQRILYFAGFMLLGGLVGGIIGFTMGYFDFKGLPNGFETENLLWLTRAILLIISALGTVFLLQARKYHKQLQLAEESDDELADELYPKTFRFLEYGTIFFNIAMSLVLFNILVAMNFYIGEDSASIFIPLLDEAFLVLLVFGQILLYKTIQKIRNYKLSTFPTISEVKDYMYSLDEGEQQANFEQAFVTQFNLNQRLLPALYVVVFFIEMITQTDQLVAYGVILTIHIFINVMQYKMVRRYFK